MIGDNIRRIANERDMTIYKISKKSRVSMSYVYDIANNKQNNPSVKILKKIAMALDVSTEELLNF